MFSRVLTRTFFFRRGQQADRKAKHGKFAPRSRSVSPQPQTTEVLQPSSPRVVGAENARTDPHEVGSQACTVTPKSSSQNLNASFNQHDENSPVRFQPYVDPAGSTEVTLDEIDRSLVYEYCNHSLTSAAEDTNNSFILVDTSDDVAKTSEADEDDDGAVETPDVDPDQDVSEQAAETPKLSSLASQEALFPEPAAITVKLPTPSGSSEQVYTTSSIVALHAPDEPPSFIGVDMLEHHQASLALESRSLYTGLLSDITEAEEPNASGVSSKEIQEEPVDAAVAADSAYIPRALLSFASFGSSYPDIHSLDTPVHLSPELQPSHSTRTRFQEVLQNILDEAVASRRPNWRDAQESQDLVHPLPVVPAPLSLSPVVPVVSSSPCSPAVSPESSEETSSGDPSAASCAQSAAPELVPQNDTITASASDKEDVKPLIVPAPSTYADAMNLALQYPEMSSRLLNEPLASACPSACPTPARSVSPPRPSVVPSPKTEQPATPTPAPAEAPDAKPKKGPAHTAERPNWARAIEDLKVDLQPRSRGRSIAPSPSTVRDGGRNGQPTKQAPRADKAPPASKPSQSPVKKSRKRQPSPVPIEPRSKQAPPAKPSIRPRDASPKKPIAVSKPDSRPSSPEKAPTLERSVLKGERAAPWMPRVRSWVQQTSNVDQTSPEAHKTPACSPEASPSMAPADPLPRPAPSPWTPPAVLPVSVPIETPVARQTQALLTAQAQPSVVPQAKVPAVPPAQALGVSSPKASAISPSKDLAVSPPEVLLVSTPQALVVSSPQAPAVLPANLPLVPQSETPAAPPSQLPSGPKAQGNPVNAEAVVVPPAASSTSPPLNPHAPAWEFKPHQRAATVCLAQSTSLHGSPSCNITAPPVSPIPLPNGFEADLQRLRVMLRDSGLEDRRLGVTPPSSQLRHCRTDPGNTQNALPSSASAQNMPVNVGTGFQTMFATQTAFHASTANGMRQRTQTYNPFGQNSSWQGATNPTHFTGLQQLAAMRGTPGFASTSNLPPPTSLSMSMSGLSPMSQLASRAALNAQPAASGTSGASYTMAIPLPPPARPSAPTAPKPANQAQQGIQFVHAGRHPGGTPSTSNPAPPAPPGSGRARPPSAHPNIVAPVPRFYGIETPLVVFDKHGWTVNSP